MEPGGPHSRAISVILLVAAAFAYPPVGSLTNPMEVLLAHNIAVVFFVALALGWSRMRVNVASRKPRHWVYASIIAAVGFLLLLRAAYDDFGLPGLDPQPISYYIPFVVIGIVLSEEFWFRGGWQTVVVGAVGVKRGILTAALIFAAYHAPEYLAYGWLLPLPVGFVLLVGLGAGFLYHKTGNLVMSIGLHSAFDFYGINGLLSLGLYPPGFDPADLAIFSALVAMVVLVVACRNLLQPRKRKGVPREARPRET